MHVDDLPSLRIGARVKAFHPRMFGVIVEGTVTYIGRRYAHIDFGPLRGGIYSVLPGDIVEEV